MRVFACYLWQQPDSLQSGIGKGVMAFNDILNDNELERKKLFEEIRKRAEEAELARIEAEEFRLNSFDTESANTPSEELRPTVQPGHIFPADLQQQLLEVVIEGVKPKRPVEELLEAAHRLYQNEQYIQALSLLDEICDERPDHSAANALRLDVEKAKALADRMKEDELRAREQDLQQAMAEDVPQVRHPAEVMAGDDEIQHNSLADRKSVV